jgi:RNA polymerase sigma-70 factor (ECF subfamily)
MLNPADLIDRIRARDPQALVELYDQFGRVAYAVALRYLRDSGETEDVVQDVFTTLWNDPGKYVARLGSFSTWLMQVVRNRSIDRLRNRNARARATQEAARLGPVDRELPDVAAPEDAEAIQRVLKEVNTLPDEQRDIIRLAYFDGLSQSQIAEKLSQPLGTVKTRMRRAMERLRLALRAFAGESRS